MALLNATKISFGYLLSLAVADQVFMGGAMVTDAYGLPLEFRYTEPVRATKLQRVLYGEVLERYIHADVIIANLVDRLEQKPALYVFSDPAYLAAVQGRGKMSVCLTETRQPPLKEIGAQQDSAEGEFLLQAADSGSPLRVRMTGDAAQRTETSRLLVEAARTMELLEPLRRVEAAVRLLWEESPEPPVPNLLESR